MKPEQPHKKIVITHLPITHKKEDVWRIVKRDRNLINAICSYSKELKKRDGIEVFERNVNIILTNEGYYCAFYQSDIDKEKTKPYESDIKPFKGIDGRMKVKLTDKNGDDTIEDLAKLVATTFLENPEKYEFVKFKDNNPENCKAENLFWSETE